MSVNAWQRRLARRGLELHLRRVSGGFYIALLTAPGAAVDQRFPPLAGIGFAGSYTEAIPMALRDFEEREREQAVLALATVDSTAVAC